MKFANLCSMYYLDQFISKTVIFYWIAQAAKSVHGVINIVLEWNDELAPRWVMSWDCLHRVDLSKLHYV